MLKLAFGATALLSPLTGIGQYAHHLARGLQQHPGVDVNFFYGTRFSRELAGRPSAAMGKLRVLVRKHVPNPYALRRAIEQWRFDAGVREAGFDVYHEPSYLALRFAGPTVVTVHDLSWIRFPGTHPPERVKALDRYLEPVLRQASLILTDSAFVAGELTEVFGVRPERIRPVPLGLDPAFRPLEPSHTRAVLTRFGLEHGHYFLSVGTMEPRKNLATTLAAYAALPPAVRSAYPLVLAGMMGWETSALQDVLAPLVRSGEVRTLGYLERADLATVTAGALTMVYPSLYEGFGLPPLEAMGCAVPPIISTAGSLLEVVADCGLAVPAEDAEALRGAMQRMVEDPQARAALAQRSLQRAGTFTWGRCVERTLAAYREAAASSR